MVLRTIWRVVRIGQRAHITLVLAEVSSMALAIYLTNSPVTSEPQQVDHWSPATDTANFEADVWSKKVSFETFGPFDLEPVTGGRAIGNSSLHAAFWEQVEAREAGLPESYGCFLVSSLKRGKSVPWYVGVANNAPFSASCFSRSINRIYASVRRIDAGATFFLHLIALSPPGERCVKPDNDGISDIKAMEAFLVSLSMNRNPALLNQGLEKFRSHASAGELVQVRLKPTIDHRAFRHILGIV